MLKTTLTLIAALLASGAAVALDDAKAQDDDGKRKLRIVRTVGGDSKGADAKGGDERRVLLRKIGEAKDSKTQSQSRKRIVVVRNGETIRDEEWVDGKKVQGGKRDVVVKPHVRIVKGGGDEAEIHVEVHAGAGDDLEGFEDIQRKLDIDLKKLMERAKKGGDVHRDSHRSSDSHTHKKIQVVENGKVVRDEEWIDGKKVKSGKVKARRLPRAGGSELDARRAEIEAKKAEIERLQKELEKALADLKKKQKRKGR